MSLLKPKSKIVLTEDLKKHIDDYETVNSITTKIPKGMAVYVHGDEHKQDSFADLVGDDVFFGEAEENTEEDKSVKKAGFSWFIDFLILVGIFSFGFILIFVINKYVL